MEKLIISPRLKKLLKSSNSTLAKKLLNTKTTEGFTQWINYLDIAKDDPSKISFVDKARFERYNKRTRSNVKHLKVGDKIKLNLKNYTHGIPNELHGQVVTITYLNSNYYDTASNTSNIGKITTDSAPCYHVCKSIIKGCVYSRIWEPEIRYMATCGKVLTKMFGQIDGKDLAKFCDVFQANHPVNNLDIEYDTDLVEGDAIREWYNEKKYHAYEKGDLGSSCMRYSKCYDWLELYSKNIDLVKLFIVKNKKSGLLIARTLIWNNQYFDRIYALNSKIQETVRVYLSRRYTEAYNIGKNIEFDIKYGADYFDSFPYCDTFSYLGKTKIANHSGIDYKHELTDAGGGGTYYTCEISGDRIDEDCDFYIEDTGWVCERFTVWSEYHDENILEDDAVHSIWIDSYIYNDDAIELHDGEYTVRSRAKRLIDGQWADEDDCEVVEVEDGLALKDDCEYSELNNIWILSSDAHYCDVQKDWVYEHQLQEEHEEVEG